MQIKKIPFCDFKHFGVIKVAQIGLVKWEVFKKNIFVQKNAMIDRTLTTPNEKIPLKTLSRDPSVHLSICPSVIRI